MPNLSQMALIVAIWIKVNLIYWYWSTVKKNKPFFIYQETLEIAGITFYLWN